MRTAWDVVAGRTALGPDRLAIRGTATVRYGELVARAAALADELAAHAAPGQVVALAATGPAAAITTILACARRRCPVLPLAMDSPSRHREWVLADARPAALVTERADGTLAVAGVDLPAGSTPTGGLDAAAYVLYTSGSTGRPKGVVVPHDGLVSRLAAVAGTPGFGPDDSILAMTSFSFDISMVELLLPLTVGGAVVSVPAGTRRDPALFADAVTREAPTVVQATPSFWRLVLAWGWHGRPGLRLWCAGEALTPSLAAALLPKVDQLWNLYGPTEATIYATLARVEPGQPVAIGTALPGTGTCLLDKHGQPVTEAHRSGELLLYGTGLALGYLNRPELTADRFMVCPTPSGPEHCYRTGDVARFDEHGVLHYLGRVDYQVKLRGHRIELGEIEAVTEELAGVREAVAVVRGADSDDPYLALFVVADPGLTARDVRRWLADRLPPAMRPRAVLPRPALPRTVTGKVDRVSLADAPA